MKSGLHQRKTLSNQLKERHQSQEPVLLLQEDQDWRSKGQSWSKEVKIERGNQGQPGPT